MKQALIASLRAAAGGMTPALAKVAETVLAQPQTTLYQSITDYCPHGVWQCTENPDSAHVFREFLSTERGWRWGYRR